MRRIYFLVPDINVTNRIVDDLLMAKIEERHIHVIAKRGTPLADLPEASFVTKKSDFIPAVETGISPWWIDWYARWIGCGDPASRINSLSQAVFCWQPHLWAPVLGAWLSGMVGMSVGNRRTKEFEEAIEAGHFLVLVDVSPDRVDEIEERVKKHLPEVEVENYRTKSTGISLISDSGYVALTVAATDTG
jgi:hypothetical protein